jgi:hypothetical protein
MKVELKKAVPPFILHHSYFILISTARVLAAGLRRIPPFSSLKKIMAELRALPLVFGL